MATTLIAFCTVIVIVSLLGGFLPLATVLNHTRLQVYLSFSAGTMLGAAFFHMIPEAVRVGSATTVRWSAAGLLSLFFLERFFSFHHHEAESLAEEPSPTAHDHCSDPAHHHRAAADSTPRPRSRMLPWGSAAFGLAVHSLAGGIALASAVAADFQVGKGMMGAGFGVFLATVLHKPADALTITSLMLRAGEGRRTYPSHQPGFCPDDPGRSGPVRDRNPHAGVGFSGRVDGGCPGVLGRDVPLRRLERPLT